MDKLDSSRIRRQLADEKYRISALIIFRACPRCGGDVDATYSEDPYCVQCAYRPELAYPGPSVLPFGYGEPEAGSDIGELDVSEIHEPNGAGRADEAVDCPRCGSTEPLRLDKVRSSYNTCYRCLHCSHIFSPAV